jgi:hypothetical protein
MRRLILFLTFGGFAFVSPAPLLAAPAQQIDCAYDLLSAPERDLIGAFMLETLASNGRKKESAEETRAADSFEARIDECSAQHGWTESEANTAFTYTGLRMMAATARTVTEEMGGDGAAADLFYAQNKYKILEEEAAGRTSQEWADSRLVEMGFAPQGSRAFDAVWLYLGLLFQSDAERDVFVTGQKPDWTK